MHTRMPASYICTPERKYPIYASPERQRPIYAPTSSIYCSCITDRLPVVGWCCVPGPSAAVRITTAQHARARSRKIERQIDR